MKQLIDVHENSGLNRQKKNRSKARVSGNRRKNYRPITILAAVDNVFEQLLSNQVTQFMEPYLSNCLTAYRKQNSWRDDFDQAYGGLERSIG